VNCTSLSLCTIPAGVNRRGRGPGPSDSPKADQHEGMPADYAEIHGIKRELPAEDQDQELNPVTADSPDHIDGGFHAVKET